jgi:hypothetical protein
VLVFQISGGRSLPYWIGGFIILFLIGAVCFQTYRLYRKEQSEQRRRAQRFALEETLSRGQMLLAQLTLSAESAPRQDLQPAAAAWLGEATELLRRQFPAVLEEFQGGAATRSSNATGADRSIADIQALTSILANLLKWF